MKKYADLVPLADDNVYRTIEIQCDYKDCLRDVARSIAATLEIPPEHFYIRNLDRTGNVAIRDGFSEQVDPWFNDGSGYIAVQIHFRAERRFLDVMVILRAVWLGPDKFAVYAYFPDDTYYVLHVNPKTKDNFAAFAEHVGGSLAAFLEAPIIKDEADKLPFGFAQWTGRIRSSTKSE